MSNMAVFLGAEPITTLHLRLYKSTNNLVITRSRRLISITNPFRTRSTARIQADPMYELLGITESETSSSSSSLYDIKKAYKKMAKKYHPDVSPPDHEYAKRFIMVREAYETLSDPETRALYDQDLARGLRFGFSPTGINQQYHHEIMEEKREWNIKWQAQLDELKQRNVKKDKMSSPWGARMRKQRL